MHESIDFRTNKIKRGANSPCRKLIKPKQRVKNTKTITPKIKIAKHKTKKKWTKKMHTQNCTNIQRTGKRRKQFDRRERETCVVVYYGRFACAAFDFQLNRCYSCFLSIALCIYEKPWFDCAHGHRRLCKCTCIVLYSFV